MSVRLNLNNLSNEQKKTIRKHLYLQPKRTNFAMNRFACVEKDPVLFYWIDKPNNEIVLPYTFCNTLLGYHVNSRLEYPFGKFNFTGQLRDNQVPVVEQALEQLKTTGTTVLSLPTGFGKSIIATYLSCKLEGIVLVLVPRETIQKGWVSTFEDNTNAGLWVVESKIKIPQQCNVIITMDGKFSKIPWEIRKMVSVLIIDEAHMFCTPSQVPALLGTCPKNVIVCTATLERTDDMHRMIQHIAGIDKLVVKNDKRFTVYKLNTGIKTEFVKNKQGYPDFSKLVADLSKNPLRNAFLVNLIEKNSEHKIMLLSWTKTHISILYDALKQRNQSVDCLFGNKSNYVDSRILLGTVGKVSTGFDSKNVAIDFDGMDITMIILAATTKSFILHNQGIGRAFRCAHPVVVDVVDDNRISMKHWKEREKNYNKMNCEIHEIFMKKRETMTEKVELMHKERLLALKDKLEIKTEKSVHEVRLEALRKKMNI